MVQLVRDKNIKLRSKNLIGAGKHHREDDGLSRKPQIFTDMVKARYKAADESVSLAGSDVAEICPLLTEDVKPQLMTPQSVISLFKEAKWLYVKLFPPNGGSACLAVNKLCASISPESHTADLGRHP
ncbi:hypothetical protein CHS0354_025755 [Potamilus streckersoni]|uniref:Uncharacterized protein n=1 Tax=Potamilus streckersoni TaxID=2493646 RepID=A0AAE0RUF2_9BIVA|nr:hypothetical protein CHS0354_025755 [Potamilus streckersoni]